MQMQLIQGRLVIAGLFSSCLIEMETLEQVLRLSQGVRVWGLRGWLLTLSNLEEQRMLYNAEKFQKKSSIKLQFVRFFNNLLRSVKPSVDTKFSNSLKKFPEQQIPYDFIAEKQKKWTSSK